MVRTRFALILYFRMVAHKAACHTLSKAFLNQEDMVQILLMLEAAPRKTDIVLSSLFTSYICILEFISLYHFDRTMHFKYL